MRHLFSGNAIKAVPDDDIRETQRVLLGHYHALAAAERRLLVGEATDQLTGVLRDFALGTETQVPFRFDEGTAPFAFPAHPRTHDSDRGDRLLAAEPRHTLRHALQITIRSIIADAEALEAELNLRSAEAAEKDRAGLDTANMELRERIDYLENALEAARQQISALL